MKKKPYKKENLPGMTLIELIVAIAILGIVSIGMSLFFSYIWRSRFYTLNIGQSSLAASQGIGKMAESLRKAAQANSGAYLLESGDDFDIVFYSDTDSDGDREKIHYYLEGNSIKKGSAEPILGINPTYPDEDEVVSILANNVVNESTEPIFKYFDHEGLELTTPVTVSSVRLVKIEVSVNTDTDEISDVTISSAVALRNLTD